ncbi:efflux RND transporter periplasmic adaptor subunit [Rhodomicrobium udaipurense]|uniref:Efflux RND transporter periplasmic adaptor subunit n=1 Tax=Rhodomicrobium udaipurense TaxID=1202716 RepID=A0A8I1GBT8_9HYPH|nr:efflux RND transporter periplasmic adaptor subunit [Rhodomicrobium udaipurense]MBJ7542089.1 efflux RND transporter periplasmic adaptor subunit [Rhodomicrobium udaipurense]
MLFSNDDYENVSSITRRRVCGVMAVILVPLALAACGDKEEAAQPVRPVKTFVVQTPSAERTLTYSGVIAPRIESQLGFRVAGKIVERFVNVGDQMKAGQKIARLDEIDLKLAENSARASVQSAKARVDVAKDAFDRAAYLLPKGFIAKAVYDQRKLEYDAATAAYTSAKDQFDQAANATSYALLVADKDGVVTAVRAEPGQVVSAGQAVISLALADSIEVTAAVPENEIARLSVGENARIALWAAPDVSSDGKIREIASAADTASRTYAVRVTITRPTPEMRLGMTTSVAFRVQEATPPVVVPLTALTEDGGKPVVYVADKEREMVKRREVTLGGVAEDGVRIKSGLVPGEIVVSGGIQFLTDGMKVRLSPDFSPTVAARGSRTY